MNQQETGQCGCEPRPFEYSIDDWHPGVGPRGTQRAVFRTRDLNISATGIGGSVRMVTGTIVVYREPDGAYDISDIGVLDGRRRGGIATALVDKVFIDTGAPYLKLTTGTTGDGTAFFGQYGEARLNGRRVVRRPARLGPPVQLQVFDDEAIAQC